MLTERDFGRSEGAAPNFEAIQVLLDVYKETDMIAKKIDVSTFQHPKILAPLK